MNNDEKFYTTVWLIIGLSILGTFLGTVAIVCISDVKKTKAMIENGYEQVMLVGNTTAQWQKIKQ